MGCPGRQGTRSRLCRAFGFCLTFRAPAGPWSAPLSEAAPSGRLLSMRMLPAQEMGVEEPFAAPSLLRRCNAALSRRRMLAAAVEEFVEEHSDHRSLIDYLAAT